VADLLTDSIGSCGYPIVCGTYGISTNGQCSCPGPKNGTDYFMQVNDRLPDQGCSLITPLSCKAYQDWTILELKNISYVNIEDNDGEFFVIDSESCKQACLKNCSCKAATYHQDSRDSLGYCFLQSQIFSLISVILPVSIQCTSRSRMSQVQSLFPQSRKITERKKNCF